MGVSLIPPIDSVQRSEEKTDYKNENYDKILYNLSL